MFLGPERPSMSKAAVSVVKMRPNSCVVSKTEFG